MNVKPLYRLALTSMLIALVGCSAVPETNQLLAANAAVLTNTPTTNIGQTYYLGVFDPHEQLPPTIYRIRVQGQAGMLSRTQFASGWVRADLVDSLSGQISLDKKGVVSTREDTPAKAEGKSSHIEDKNRLNRRLVMFGPEGFREAPKDHRLVIVMGSSPDVFFSSVDRALGVVAAVTQPGTAGAALPQAVLSDLAHLREERRAVQTVLDLTGGN